MWPWVLCLTWWSDPKVKSDVNLPPGVHTFVRSPLLECGQDPWFASNQWNMERWLIGSYSCDYILLYKTLLVDWREKRRDSCWLYRSNLPRCERAEGKGRMAENTGWPIGAESGPLLTASKEMVTSVLELQRDELCQQTEWDWSRSFPSQASDETAALADTWIAAYWDPEAEKSAKLCPDFWSTETVR